MLQLEAYLISGHRQTHLLSLDDTSGYAARPVDDPQLVLPLSLLAGESADVLLRYRSFADTPLLLELFSPSHFEQYSKESFLSNGLVMGILLAFLCVVLLQAFVSPNRIYVFYAGFIICVLLVISDMSGYTLKYLWPDQPSWDNSAPQKLFSLQGLFYALFIVHLLQLKRYSTGLYRCYLAFIAFTLMAFGLSFFIEIAAALRITALAIMPLMLVTIVISVKKKLPAARILAAGLVVHIIFINLLFFLGILGVEVFGHVHLFTYPKVGYVIETLLFAVAISLQNRQLRIEHSENLRHRLAEAEELAHSEMDKRRILERTQDKILQFATTTHDLSQPLSSIRMALEAVDDKQSRAAKAHIDRTLEYAEGLLRTIIREAQSDLSEVQEICELQQVFESILLRHKGHAQKKKLSLRIYDTALRAQVSPILLERILDNLVANAIRYTDKGGVLLGVRHIDARIALSIYDTGHGMEQGLIKRLLNPFEQSGELAAEQTGYGLGLYIVKSLCEKASFELRILSRPGKGSCFTILISRQCLLD